MSKTTPHSKVTDEQLVAYLDKSLPSDARTLVSTALLEDKDLRERLAELERGGEALKAAGEAIADLPVPVKNLEAILDEAIDDAQYTPGNIAQQGARRPEPVHLVGVAASLVMSFALGISATKEYWPTPPEIVKVEVPVEVTPPASWKMAVVDYVKLYTNETFAESYAEPQVLRKQLDHLEGQLDLELPTRSLDLPRLRLVRAEILSFKNKPLGQVIFADGEGNPIALCIIRKQSNEPVPKSKPVDRTALTVEREGDLNLVKWDQPGFGYIVIGRVDPETLVAISDELSSRLL